jgi:hypothetical protein
VVLKGKSVFSHETGGRMTQLKYSSLQNRVVPSLYQSAELAATSLGVPLSNGDLGILKGACFFL